jgi:hypothetical protein
MSTEATQGTGADVTDLESMFDDGADNSVNQNQTQVQSTADTQTQQDGNDELVITEGDSAQPTIELDADGNEIEVQVDPNAPVVLEIPDDHIVKMKVDGKEVEYRYGDLVANAQKFEAAEKRFGEAAAIRKEYTEKAQTIVQREQQLGQVLEYYINQSQTLMQAQEPNWADLLANDPQKYLTERHNWEIKQAQLMQARQVQANVERQKAEQQAASANQRVHEAKVKLQTAIPEWSDPKKAAEGAIAIDRYLHEAGIAPEMRQAIDSAEVLLIARKAMLYDQAVAAAKARKLGGAQQAQGQQVQAGQRQQVRQQQPRVERPGAATAAQTQASRQNLGRANAAKAFSANPSVDTLASFFE